MFKHFTKVDARGWFMVGLFGLGAGELAALAQEPTLAKVGLFADVMKATFYTGILTLVGGYFFTASKSGASPPDPPSPKSEA